MEIINIAESFSEGGCYYMAIANAFAAYMGSIENGEQIFKDRMGFDIKTTAAGKMSYNLEAIALDIFLKTAKKVTNGDVSKIQNAGTIKVSTLQLNGQTVVLNTEAWYDQEGNFHRIYYWGI